MRLSTWLENRGVRRTALFGGGGLLMAMVAVMAALGAGAPRPHESLAVMVELAPPPKAAPVPVGPPIDVRPDGNLKSEPSAPINMPGVGLGDSALLKSPSDAIMGEDEEPGTTSLAAPSPARGRNGPEASIDPELQAPDPLDSLLDQEPDLRAEVARVERLYRFALATEPDPDRLTRDQYDWRASLRSAASVDPEAARSLIETRADALDPPDPD